MKKLSAVMCAVLLMLGMAVNVEAQPAGGNDFSTSVNPRVNQAVLTLKDGALRYYNTADVSSIDVADDGKTVTVNQQVGTYTFNGQVTGIAFRKADKGGEEQGQVVNVDGKVQITEQGLAGVCLREVPEVCGGCRL